MGGNPSLPQLLKRSTIPNLLERWRQRHLLKNRSQKNLPISVIFALSLRANETKMWGFQFRIEFGKGCRGKQIEHCYLKFEKKSNGDFSEFLSFIDRRYFEFNISCFEKK